MTLISSIDLPCEAVKAILSFMTRKQLVVLSDINRQFYHVIHSPPLTRKPVYRASWIDTHHSDYCMMKKSWIVAIEGHFIRCSIADVATHLEPIISQQWMRFEEVLLDLPEESHLRRAWLELFVENSHCLQGAKKLSIYHHDRLEADVVEIIDKFRTLVAEVDTLFIPPPQIG